MIKFEAVIQRCASVKDACSESGRECAVDPLPKFRLQRVPPRRPVGCTVETLLKTAKTGKRGDGKIFLSRIEDSIRIGNERRGESAL